MCLGGDESSVRTYLSNLWKALWQIPLPRVAPTKAARKPIKPLLGSLTYTTYTKFDYNGWRLNSGEGPQFLWASPAAGEASNFSLTNTDLQSYRTFDQFQRGTGQEKHGRLVDYDIFENVLSPDPTDPHRVYEIGNLDFRLRAGSGAVDAGCRLPGVNDDFSGKAPDLGALELGRPQPVYGPRRRSEQ